MQFANATIGIWFLLNEMSKSDPCRNFSSFNSCVVKWTILSKTSKWTSGHSLCHIENSNLMWNSLGSRHLGVKTRIQPHLGIRISGKRLFEYNCLGENFTPFGYEKFWVNLVKFLNDYFRFYTTLHSSCSFKLHGQVCKFLTYHSSHVWPAKILLVSNSTQFDMHLQFCPI